jgi:crotonobetainyl-CoA:carnitine CoA-transferase CaiB-like acyl-CoA transferase
VIENFSPRVMENWGFDYETMRGLRSDLIMLRMPAFGLTGPWRDRVGFAQTMEQVAGLAWTTGYPDDAPQSPNGPCDPIGGLHGSIALLLALEHRRRTGEGMLIECPQVGGALNLAAEQVIAFDAESVILERHGNRHPVHAPQGLYLSGDTDSAGNRNRWVAIAVDSDDQWASLVREVGHATWAADEQLANSGGRQDRHDELDAVLAKWCEGRTADDIVEALWPVGVPVAKVMMAHEQAELAQLSARGFFEEVDHPVTGRGRYSTDAMVRSNESPANPSRRAPLLGEHNADVLCELGGLSREEVAQLEADGVISTQVRMG